MQEGGGQITHEYLRLTAAEKESSAVRLLVNVGSVVRWQRLFQSWFIGKQLLEDGNESVRRQNEAEWQTSDRVWLKLRMENWWCVRMTTDVIWMEPAGEKCLSVKWIRIRQLTDPAHNSQMSFAGKRSNVGIMYGTRFEITSSYQKVSSGGRRKDRVSPEHHRGGPSVNSNFQKAMHSFCFQPWFLPVWGLSRPMNPGFRGH